MSTVFSREITVFIFFLQAHAGLNQIYNVRLNGVTFERFGQVRELLRCIYLGRDKLAMFTITVYVNINVYMYIYIYIDARAQVFSAIRRVDLV